MTKRFFVSNAVVALFLALPSWTWAAEVDPVPSLTADADGIALFAPDLVTVALGVVSQAASAGAALNANNADMTKVRVAITAAGIAAADVATENFAIRPLYSDTSRGGTARIDGFEVSNLVEVKIHDIQNSGTILDRILSAGANRVSNIDFTLADPQAANDRATAAAITEARHKAELMADAAGVKLGRIISVSMSGQTFGPRAAMGGFAAASAVPFAPGQHSITAHATIVWEIAPQ